MGGANTLVFVINLYSSSETISQTDKKEKQIIKYKAINPSNTDSEKL